MRRAIQYAFAAAGVLVTSTPALAHQTGRTAVAWSWPPYIVVPLFATGILYAIGLLKMRQRLPKLDHWGILSFAGGWLSLLIALDSPIHEISEQLFWVHMTQHEILMLIAAPLLVLSRPAVPFLWALPARWRERFADIATAPVSKRVWIALSAPLAAWLLHGTALWVWHAPRLFAATLSSEAVHAAQHVSFLGSALLFWWALLHNHGRRLGYGGAVVYVFTTAIHTSVLGALLTFAPRAWYSPYLATAPAWHLTALEDQQIGGLIMWIPAGVLLTLIGLGLLVKWLQESQRRWEYTQTAAFLRAAGGTRV